MYKSPSFSAASNNVLKLRIRWRQIRKPGWLMMRTLRALTWISHQFQCQKLTLPDCNQQPNTFHNGRTWRNRQLSRFRNCEANSRRWFVRPWDYNYHKRSINGKWIEQTKRPSRMLRIWRQQEWTPCQYRQIKSSLRQVFAAVVLRLKNTESETERVVQVAAAEIEMALMVAVARNDDQKKWRGQLGLRTLSKQKRDA